MVFTVLELKIARTLKKLAYIMHFNYVLALCVSILSFDFEFGNENLSVIRVKSEQNAQ